MSNKNTPSIRNIQRYVSRTLDRIYTDKSMRDSEMILIMTNMRLLIESNNWQEKYNTLNLYCNWLLHTSLQGSSTIYYILEEVNRSIYNNDADEAIKNISKSLSLEALREELIILFNEFNLNSLILTNDSNWQGFASLVIEQILDKPIHFPSIEEMKNPRNKKKYKTAYKIYLNLESKTTHSIFDSTRHYGEDDPNREKIFVRQIVIRQDSNNYNNHPFIEVSLVPGGQVKLNAPLVI